MAVSKEEAQRLLRQCIEEAAKGLARALNRALSADCWPVVGLGDASERHLTFFFARALSRRGYDLYFEWSFSNGRKMDMVAVHWKKRHLVACEAKLYYRGEGGRRAAVKSDIERLDKFALKPWREGRPLRMSRDNVVLASSWGDKADWDWDAKDRGSRCKGESPAAVDENEKPNHRQQYLLYLIWRAKRATMRSQATRRQSDKEVPSPSREGRGRRPGRSTVGAGWREGV